MGETGYDIEIPLLESPDDSRLSGLVCSSIEVFDSKKARVFATEELDPPRVNSRGNVEEGGFGTTTTRPGDPFPAPRSWVEPLGVGELETLSLSSS